MIGFRVDALSCGRSLTPTERVIEGEPCVLGGLSSPQMTATGIGTTESSCQDRNTVAKQRGEKGDSSGFCIQLTAPQREGTREGGREGRQCVRRIRQ